MRLLALEHMQKPELCIYWVLFPYNVTFSKWHCLQEVIHEFPRSFGVDFFTICWLRGSQKDRATMVFNSRIIILSTTEKGGNLSHRKCKSTAEKEPESTFSWVPITSFNQVKFKNKFQDWATLPQVLTDKLRSRWELGAILNGEACRWWSMLNDGDFPLIYKQHLCQQSRRGGPGKWVSGCWLFHINSAFLLSSPPSPSTVKGIHTHLLLRVGLRNWGWFCGFIFLFFFLFQ